MLREFLDEPDTPLDIQVALRLSKKCFWLEIANPKASSILHSASKAVFPPTFIIWCLFNHINSVILIPPNF